ncbi:hypothetical protein MKW92_041374 [Papaver armeniacum]|nr:hypothetical protein MKW92_041374 [Papaver armeniacum]
MASSLQTIFLFVSLIFFVEICQAARTFTDFEKEILLSHNSARQDVGVPPLVWNDILAKYARIYSGDIKRKGCDLNYSNRYGFGESLYKGINVTGKAAVEAWVSQKIWYHHDNNTCTSGHDCSDYKQVVWKNSIRVGCYRFKCRDGDNFVTCEYYPPGNYKGARPY